MKRKFILFLSLLTSISMLTGCGSSEKSCQHVDADKNHFCDSCNFKMGECEDKNSDHKCDYCGKSLSQCSDNNNDHLCDYCSKKLTECKDDNKDHNCDICSKKLSDCVDKNNDHKCDICSKKLSDCADSNNDHLCDLCGSKLSDCVDTNNDHYCETCKAKMSDCYDNNNDHLCDICSIKVSECEDKNHDHFCDICFTQTNHKDEDIDGKCDICSATWSNATKTLFKNLYGEMLPYFYVDVDFVVKNNYLEATAAGDYVEEIKDSFLSTKKYTHEEGTYLEEPCDFYYKTCTNNSFKTIRVQVIYNGTTTYVDADYINTEITSVPSKQIKDFLSNKTTVEPIIPTDGTVFGYEENIDSCYLFLNGSSEKFLNQLIAAEYYIDKSYDIYNDSTTFRAICKQRTLAVEVSTYDVSGESKFTYQICYFVETAPNENEWNLISKEKMTTLLGEELPFINAGFIFNEISNDILTASSKNIDAYKYAVEAFENDQNYEGKYDSTTEIYTFIKDCTQHLITVEISVVLGETYIKAYLSSPTSSEWPIERILDCFTIEINDTIPAAPGSYFKLYYEEEHPNIVIVTVKGTSQNYAQYLLDLQTAGYTVSTDPLTGYIQAVAPNKTVQMYIGDYTYQTGEVEPFYTIEIQAIKDSSTSQETEFPLAKVNAEMSPVTYTGPVPTGETFTVSYPYGENSQDIKISITGGDKSSFVQALLDDGFEYDSSYSYQGQYIAYTKPTANLAIYIEETNSNTDYYIEIGTYSFF